MSGKHKKGYKKILKAAIELLPSVKVQTITINFEAAMWQVIQLVLPTVQIYGCYLHWSQAVWRKLQILGLQVAYTEDNSTYKFIQKLLALPYLPAEHIIQPIFIKFVEKAVTQPLLELTNYISSTWLNNSLWPVTSGSVFRHFTRTNNDVEGWHNHLNRKSKKPQQSLYVLMPLLHDEQIQVEMHVWLIS